MFQNNTGRIINCRDDFTPTFRREVPKAHSHMRVGHFAVVTTTEGDCWVSQKFADDGLQVILSSGPEYMADTLKDRGQQLHRIERVIKSTHPLFAAVTAAIKAERERHAQLRQLMLVRGLKS